VTIKVTFMEKRQTDRGQNGRHNGIIKVTFIEKGRQITVKMGDIMGPLKSHS